jgi:putative OPT family oligopeptide transporter
MPVQAVPPQLTIKAMVLGIVLAAVLAGANAYLGLFAGMTVSASIPAAVISMGILRLFRNSNILENNIVQTAASAGESLAAGVIFTLPALILMGYWNVFEYWWVCAIAGLGGLLGVLFTIPLRRSLIVEEGLAFPEGTATAHVLQAGERAGRGLKLLSLAAVTGAAVKFAETGLRLWPGVAQSATYIGGSTVTYIGTNLSPALLSVGYIVGLNIAVLVFLGGVISWGIAIPIYSNWLSPSDVGLWAEYQAGASAVDLAFSIWTSKVRYLGVGAMLVGGIWALVSMRGSLLAGVRSGLQQHAQSGGFVPHRKRRRWTGHDPDDGCHRFFVFVGGRLHGRSGRLIEQPHFRRYDRDDTICLAVTVVDDWRRSDWPRGRHHDRRRGCQCRRDCRRQYAGS